MTFIYQLDRNPFKLYPPTKHKLYTSGFPKLFDGSIFYRTGVMCDQSLHCRNRTFLVPVTFTLNQ